MKTEQYLFDEYDLFVNETYLSTESDIEPYFKENGSDWLECGQGYCQDTADIFCKVGDKFYDITIIGEVTSSKQDVGDRLYWIDYIKSVTWRETMKPEKLDEFVISYKIEATKFNIDELEQFMTSNKIKFKQI